MPSTYSNVVVLHPQLPHLTARQRAQMDLIDLFGELDEDSQRVIVAQLESTQARIRPYTRTAAVVRGEVRPVSWRRGEGARVRVGPDARGWLFHRATHN